MFDEEEKEHEMIKECLMVLVFTKGIMHVKPLKNTKRYEIKNTYRIRNFTILIHNNKLNFPFRLSKKCLPLNL